MKPYIFNLTPAQDEALDRLATAASVSRAEIIRRMIDQAAERLAWAETEFQGPDPAVVDPATLVQS